MVFFILTHHPAPAAMEGLSMWNRHADFDVIFLLCGMMVIVNIMRDSGIFQYVAIKCAKLGRGYHLPVLALLLVATAALSAFLDNVTTVLLMAPVTLLVATEMKVSPVTFLIPETTPFVSFLARTKGKHIIQSSRRPRSLPGFAMVWNSCVTTFLLGLVLS